LLILSNWVRYLLEKKGLNIRMSNEKKTRQHGGARKGAGRKPGSRDQITIKSLLEALDRKSGGRDYEELLVEDFLDARNNNDTQLMLKYHNLILNKVMNSLARIEVTDSKDAVEAKQRAFAEALARLTGVSQEQDK
jgi:hypothetical protein